MASGDTPYYGLNLWNPEDHFLREEFNRDNQKTDAALDATAGLAQRALSALEDLGYNVFHLVLQHYCDGKQTGYKKAMIFDGFQDGDMIASLTGGLQRGGGLLTLQGVGMGDIDLGFGGTGGGSESTGTQTATGSAALRGFTYQTYSSLSYVSQLIVDYKLYLNGGVAASGQYTFNNVPAAATVTRTLNFSPQVTVRSGDRFYLTLSTDSGTAHHFVSGGIFRISSASGQNGRMTGTAQSLPACAGATAWVRYKNGRAALSVADGSGGEYQMEPDGQRQTVNVQGAACTEASFRLHRGLEAGGVAVLLDAALDGAASMEIYDYGVVFL